MCRQTKASSGLERIDEDTDEEKYITVFVCVQKWKVRRQQVRIEDSVKKRGIELF